MPSASVLAFCLASLLASPRQSPMPVKAIRAGRLVDVVAGKVLNDQVILIRGERIAEVGGNVKIPADAQVIDLSAYTVLPGLIDCHTHLLSAFDGKLGFDDVNGNLMLVTMNTTQRALLGARNARECLEAGITTVRDLGNSGTNGDVALRDAINRGWVPGPRMLCATRALSSPGGQFGRLPKENQAMVAVEYAEISGPEEARKAVRRAIQDGADLIKVIVDTYPAVLSKDEMVAIVDEAHRVGLKVAAHCITAMAQRIAAEAGVDSIEHAYTADREAFATMAKKGIFLVPTDVPMDDVFGSKIPANELQEMESRVAVRTMLAKRSGIPIAFGSDMYYDHPRKSRGQSSIATLGSYVRQGLTPMEAIQAATVNAAKLCGWSDRIGALQPGHFADIVAVRRDPLADVTTLANADFVMKGGAVVRGDKR